MLSGGREGVFFSGAHADFTADWYRDVGAAVVRRLKAIFPSDLGNPLWRGAVAGLDGHSTGSERITRAGPTVVSSTPNSPQATWLPRRRGRRGASAQNLSSTLDSLAWGLGLLGGVDGHSLDSEHIIVTTGAPLDFDGGR